MEAPAGQRLEVPGASLYYEQVGQGPMLLCISGADGSCEIWRGFAQALKTHFTVVAWDRRGFSRSYLTGSQDYSRRLETDTDDAARLVDYVSPDHRATVIGNSSGAIVALRFLTRYSTKIQTLLAYEPPAARFLPDFNDLWKVHEETYATYRAHGPHPALESFASLVETDPMMIRMVLDPTRGPYVFANIMYWFEREFNVYPKAEWDIDAIAQVKQKLVLVNGELSKKTPYQYRANAALAENLGLEVVLFPGEHVGHGTHADAFGKRLLEVLKEKDKFYASL